MYNRRDYIGARVTFLVCIAVAPPFFASRGAEFDVDALTRCIPSFVHAIALATPVFFAVYPKATTNFARPSLFVLPWRSYAVFGGVSFLLSYLVPVLLLFTTYNMISISGVWVGKSHPLATSALSSLLYPVNTLVLSILLDMRLKPGGPDYRKARLRDGAINAVVIASVGLCGLIGFRLMAAHYDAPYITLPVYTFLVVIYGALGFTMGYLVPSTGEAYIEANKLIRRSSPLDGKLLG